MAGFFDPTEHPRGPAGQFVERTHSAPEVSLAVPATPATIGGPVAPSAPTEPPHLGEGFHLNFPLGSGLNPANVSTPAPAARPGANKAPAGNGTHAPQNGAAARHASEHGGQSRTPATQEPPHDLPQGPGAADPAGTPPAPSHAGSTPPALDDNATNAGVSSTSAKPAPATSTPDRGQPLSHPSGAASFGGVGAPSQPTPPSRLEPATLGSTPASPVTPAPSPHASAPPAPASEPAATKVPPPPAGRLHPTSPEHPKPPGPTVPNETSTLSPEPTPPTTPTPPPRSSAQPVPNVLDTEPPTPTAPESLEANPLGLAGDVLEQVRAAKAAWAITLSTTTVESEGGESDAEHSTGGA